MDNSAIASRAALDAARAVFSRMTAAGDLTGTSAALSAGAPSAGGSADGVTPRGRSVAAWTAAEDILRNATGRGELGGQALVGEARRSELLTLGDAHVLVALHRWMEQQRESAEGALAGAPSDAERAVAREAMLALEHAVAVVQREAARGASGSAPSGPAAGPRDYSREGASANAAGAGAAGAYAAGAYAAGAGAGASAGVGATDFSVSGSRRTASGGYGPPGTGGSPSMAAPVGSASSAADIASAPPRRGRRGSPAVLLGALVLLLLVGAGLYYAFGRGGAAAYEEGTEAYRRGSREAASLAFAKAATDDPSDPRPLIYLGRIAREQGDLARARRFLDRAVRLAPDNALAQREMASTMLADANPELARRFYVRALELDPTDRLSQGFLACALHRLGRFDDARRFVERAGTGEWTPCLSTPVIPGGAIPPNGAMPNGAMPNGAMQPPPGTPR